MERFMIFLTPYATAENRLGTLCGRLVKKADAIAAIRPATGAECAASQGARQKSRTILAKWCSMRSKTRIEKGPGYKY